MYFSSKFQDLSKIICPSKPIKACAKYMQHNKFHSNVKKIADLMAKHEN